MQQFFNQLVQFLQQPQVNLDVWKILEAVMDLFDKRTGLTELVYGMSARQLRTASEVQAKKEQISVRPDYMSARVDIVGTELARKEGFCARWYITGEDILPFLGKTAAMMWDQLVLSQDVNKVVREMEYRVEAGSSRKPNLEKKIADSEQALQYFSPSFQAYAQTTGDTQAFNALVHEWGLATQVDTRGMMLGNWIDPMKVQQMRMQAQQMAMQQQQAAQAPVEGPPQEGGPPPEGPPQNGEAMPEMAMMG